MAYKYSTLPLPLTVKYRLKDLWQRYGTWKYLGIFLLTKIIWTAVLFAIYHYLSPFFTRCGNHCQHYVHKFCCPSRKSPTSAINADDEGC